MLAEHSGTTYRQRRGETETRQSMQAGEQMTDKIILITGGSRGIGAATAQLAAVQGYAVCISYLQRSEAA